MTIELWWQDEARIGQQGSLTYVWAEKGSRPRAPRDQRYAWAYLFGAVCPERGIGAGLVLPFVNTEAMNLHLTEISRTITPGAHCLLTLDGAGWHQTGGGLVLPDNISLLLLPPYSPELNPVETFGSSYIRTISPTAYSPPRTPLSPHAATLGTRSPQHPTPSAASQPVNGQGRSKRRAAGMRRSL